MGVPMNKHLAAGLVVLCCALGAARASASVCEASYEAEGRKPTGWFALGEISGPKSKSNCNAMAKNDAANRKPAELGIVKPDCGMIPVTVAIYTRLDEKEKRDASVGSIKTSLGLKCAPPEKPKEKEKTPPKK